MNGLCGVGIASDLLLTTATTTTAAAGGATGGTPTWSNLMASAHGGKESCGARIASAPTVTRMGCGAVSTARGSTGNRRTRITTARRARGGTNDRAETLPVLRRESQPNQRLLF